MPSDLAHEAETIHLLCLVHHRASRSLPARERDIAHERHVAEIAARIERLIAQRPPTGLIEK